MQTKFSFFSSPLNFYYLLPLMFIFLFSGCEKDTMGDIGSPAADGLQMKAKGHKEKVNTFYGPAQPYGNGVVRAMVTMNHDGEPEAIGVKISEKVLRDLPDEHEILTLRLPNKMEGLAIDHIDLDWNPHGHEPEMFYGARHFDFHFYMISPEEKMQIVPRTQEEIVLPEMQYWPANYFPTMEVVPNMGMHWLSEFAPELGGADFTHTFIYGSYDGEFIFYEPMITLDYLQNATGESFDISQPQEFQRTGYYYPTSYRISYDATKKEYTVLLEDMVLRE